MARFRSDSLALVLGIFAVLPSTANGAAANRELEGIRKKIENEKKAFPSFKSKKGRCSILWEKFKASSTCGTKS